MESLDLTDTIASLNENVSRESQTSADQTTNKLLKGKKCTAPKNSFKLEQALPDYIQSRRIH